MLPIFVRIVISMMMTIMMIVMIAIIMIVMTIVVVMIMVMVPAIVFPDVRKTSCQEERTARGINAITRAVRVVIVPEIIMAITGAREVIVPKVPGGDHKVGGIIKSRILVDGR